MDGILFRTTDGTKWGAGKGAPLTAGEIDLNMWDLLTRMETLETHPPTAVSISNISVIGTQVQFNMSDGSHFGPFTLPTAMFQLRGDYAGGTHYNELDVISVIGVGLFIVKVAHDAPAPPAPFDPAATDGSGHALYFQVFASDALIYDFGWFYPGRPGVGIEDGAALASHVLVRPVTLPQGLPGSKAELFTATTAALSFPLKKNGTVIGSIDFAPGATVGTFVFTADVACVVGDAIRLIKPTAIDAGARELSITIMGTRA